MTQENTIGSRYDKKLVAQVTDLASYREADYLFGLAKVAGSSRSKADFYQDCLVLNGKQVFDGFSGQIQYQEAKV